MLFGAFYHALSVVGELVFLVLVLFAVSLFALFAAESYLLYPMYYVGSLKRSNNGNRVGSALLGVFRI